jgi:hypothetical protein
MPKVSALRNLVDDEAELYSIERRTHPRYDTGRNFGDGSGTDHEPETVWALSDSPRDQIVKLRDGEFSYVTFRPED